MSILENHNEEREEEQGEKIRVSLRLAPGVHDASLEVPSDPIAVPANLRRKGLSALVNHMLGRDVRIEEEKSVDESDDEDEVKLPMLPFDFILNGKLLRMGIEAAVRRDGLSLEEVVDIHYFVAQAPPRHSGTSEELPDWVSALSFSSGIQQKNKTALPQYDGLLLSGCYDGSIRALSPNTCAVVTSVKAHSGAIKCIDSNAWNKGDNTDGRDILIATGSMDQTLLTHILSFPNSNDPDLVEKPTMTLHCKYIDGHSNSVESVALNQSSNGDYILASGDWDGNMCLWKVPLNMEGTTTESHSNVSASKKRVKVDPASFVTGKKLPETSAVVSSIAKLTSHTANISGISWGVKGGSNKQHLITSSWDHSCKVWDVERQECALSLNGSRVVSALGRCVNSDIIATGHVSLCK
jgi:ribosome biogenesis protein YTM1